MIRVLITSMGGMVNQNQLRAFATVTRTKKHLIFVSERDRVFFVKPNAGKGETKTKYNKVNAKHLKFSEALSVFPAGQVTTADQKDASLFAAFWKAMCALFR